MVRAALDAAHDPFAALVAFTRQREQYAFGERFVFEHPLDDDQERMADVRRCFFHDVLEAEQATHLRPVLCAWDANWMDAVDPERHGVVAERRTSIGLGGGHCPFHLRRTRAR